MNICHATNMHVQTHTHREKVIKSPQTEAEGGENHAPLGFNQEPDCV